MQQQKGSQPYKIITQYGDMLVIKQATGNSSGSAANQAAPGSTCSSQVGVAGNNQQAQTRPVIMTFHDLGLNSELQFASFCECDEVKLMLQTFTVLHVNFVGQELDADRLPADFKYPTVEQLAECIVDVCAHLRVRSFIGLAVGAGAHIASLLALLRPDLVDGLFLINPVVASCSITEWLYFKMSAIASNHHHSDHHHHHHHHSDHHQNRTTSPTHSSGGDSETTPTDSPGRSGKHSSSRLRKLLSAASSHIHLPHLHASSTSGSNANENLIEDSSEWTTQPDGSPPAVPGPEVERSGKKNTELADDNSSLASSYSSSASNTSATPSHSKLPNGPAGSRLRRLILSRNFRLGGASRHHHQRSTATDIPPLSSAGGGHLAGQHERTSPSSVNRKLSGASSGSSGGSQRSLTSGKDDEQMGSKERRAPYEYLMYHHFGPSTFQRYRRNSGSYLPASPGESDSPEKVQVEHTDESTGHETVESSPVHSSLFGGISLRDEALTKSSEGSERSAAGEQLSRVRANACSRSHDSLTSATSKQTVDRSPAQVNAAQTLLGRRLRSGSLCLSSTHLASFSNERNKHAYMYSVYRHYFGQLNSHNLWLFAQSFAKRKALNLRRDCGAAAHAAAAAAALGTSICTALVGTGMGPAPTNAGGEMSSSLDSSSAAHISPSKQKLSQGSSKASHSHDQVKVDSSAPQQKQKQKQKQQLQQQQQQHEQRNSKALVAGTKVRRTLTCQTLIMCSSVQMHCERAFKLMSLLNPLQATWIKTDQLLVLEEKPEKVCQALRLFLQGIGYSMSTYERRLRLSSNTGSAGSNDSSGSLRSLNNER